MLRELQDGERPELHKRLQRRRGKRSDGGKSLLSQTIAPVEAELLLQTGNVLTKAQMKLTYCTRFIHDFERAGRYGLCIAAFAQIGVMFFKRARELLSEVAAFQLLLNDLQELG